MYLRVKWENPILLNDCEKANLLTKCMDKNRKNRNGIYVIWSVDDSTIVYVGSGDIYQRLYDHIDRSDDPVVKRRDNYPHLMASYAFIEMKKIYEGAENYLAYMYQPQLGENFPNVMLREVNLIPNEYFNIEPRIYGILSTDFADNWQEYVNDFRRWAIEIQKRDPNDLKEPQQCIATNLCLENLQAETRGEEFYFKDFLGALLSTESERAFVEQLRTAATQYPTKSKDWKWEVTNDSGECRSILSDVIQHSNAREKTKMVAELQTYTPNLFLYEKIKTGVPNLRIACETKTFDNNEDFTNFLEDFSKIRIMANLLPDVDYYVFLLRDIDRETVKSLMQEKVPEGGWNRYYPEMVCVFLHNGSRSLDYTRLRYIKIEIVKWKSTYGYTLSRIKLEQHCKKDIDQNGIYIIWTESSGQVIYIGSGPIYRIWNHLTDDWAQNCKENLLVNYTLDCYDKDLGIVKFLTDIYQPFYKGERSLDGIKPIEVNLPVLPKLPVSTQE